MPSWIDKVVIVDDGSEHAHELDEVDLGAESAAVEGRDVPASGAASGTVRIVPVRLLG